MSGPTPRKKAVAYVCTVCDLPWEQHEAGEDGKVDVTECVRLLKERPATTVVPSVWSPSVSSSYYQCLNCGAWVNHSSWHSCGALPAYPLWTNTTSGVPNNVTMTTSSSNTGATIYHLGGLPSGRDEDGPDAVGVPA